MNFRLVDTFNTTVISEHRSLEAAVKAERRFLRAVERANGRGSYIPTQIDVQISERNWTQVDPEDVSDARQSLDRANL